MKLESTLKKLAKQAASAASGDAIAGIWRNELGSTMELDVLNGLVNGTYTTPPGGAQVTGKIKGFAKADLLAVVIRWNVPGAAMTSWVAQMERRGGERLRTLWHLAHSAPDQDEPRELSISVLAGTDLFRRA